MKKKTPPPIKEKDKTCCSINSKSKGELIDRIHLQDESLEAIQDKIKSLAPSYHMKENELSNRINALEEREQQSITKVNNLEVDIGSRELQIKELLILIAYMHDKFTSLMKHNADINSALDHLNDYVHRMQASGAYYIT